MALSLSISVADEKVDNLQQHYSNELGKDIGFKELKHHLREDLKIEINEKARKTSKK